MSVWMHQIGDDSLFCRRESSNEYDEYVAAIAAIDNFKREEVVRHVPFFLSKTLKKFLRLHRSYASCKVTGTRINRGVGVGLEIPINTNTFCWEWNGDWMASKSIVSHKYDDWRKSFKAWKWKYFFKKMKFFLCNAALSLSFPMKKWGCPSYISKISRRCIKICPF